MSSRTIEVRRADRHLRRVGVTDVGQVGRGHAGGPVIEVIPGRGGVDKTHGVGDTRIRG